MHVQITHTYTHVCTLSLQTCPAVSFSTGDSPCLGGDDTITCRCFFTLESSNISTDLLPLGFSDDDDNAGDDDDEAVVGDWGPWGESASQWVDEEALRRFPRLLEVWTSNGTTPKG